MDPLGQFLYTANFDSNDVSAFIVNASTAVLTAVSGSPFITGTGQTSPKAVVVDPSGKFVYAANENSSNISAFTLNRGTGALTPVTRSPFYMGVGVNESIPVAVVVDPSGKFVYAADTCNNVYAFTIDSTTGALTAVSGSPFATGTEATTVAVVVDPSGKFVYTANRNSSSISAFTLNRDTGALTAVTGSPFAVGAGPGPGWVWVDPSGKFVYTINDESVWAFTIDSTTGCLTAVTGSPFTVGCTSYAMAGYGQFVYITGAVGQGNGQIQGKMSVFSLNVTTGALTKVPQSPYDITNLPWSVVVAHSSRA